MKLNRVKLVLTISILGIINLYAQKTHEIYVKEFGAKGDGVTLDTKAIQDAVNKCSEIGGTVVFTPGIYLTGSIELKDNTDIYISNGVVIQGSTDIKDYTDKQPGFKSYNDAFLRYSIFYAEKVKNISIRGEGTIDGQGSFFKVTTRVKPDRYKNRPYVIRFVQCEDIKIENITLQNSAMWMQQYLACSDLVIRGIKVYNHANQNNDMMDIDGCKNVIISDCIGDTDDDGITLKSTSPSITENVVISNCIVSSHCNALKMGTESIGGFRNIAISNIVIKPSRAEKTIYGTPNGTSGISLELVDGGILEGVTISNIKIDGPDVPVFLRLGNRARKYMENAPTPPVGSFKNVTICDVIAENVKSYGCSITGLKNHNIEGVSLNNIKIIYEGGIKHGDFKTSVSELEDSYPEGTMWGNLPAYGLYVRHAENIKLDNIEFSFKQNDERSAIVLDDVKDIKVNGLDAKICKDAGEVINISGGRNIFLENSSSDGNAEKFVNVTDANSKDIFISGSDFRNVKKPFIQKSEGQVKLLTGNILNN